MIAFNKEAEEAVNLYVSAFSSAFGNSKILKTCTMEKKSLRR
jgi:predicted 3-demethylubiquinone-9 3-methyltransferase (glyoxalase superfamily)